MENTLGFAHFLTNADAIAQFVLGVMLIASIGTWYLIATKGIQLVRMHHRSESFLAAFWEIGRAHV